MQRCPPTPLVLIDGDTIGRGRTGDESYTINLLRELPGAAPELSLACSLRDPQDVPSDVPAAVRRLALPVASPYRRIPLAFPALAPQGGRRARARAVLRLAAPALPGRRDGA